MEKIEAFVEYGRVLQDLEDWLSQGYRTHRKADSVILPEPPVESSGEHPPINALPQTMAQKPPMANRVPPSSTERSVPSAPTSFSSPAMIQEEGGLQDIAGEVAACRDCTLYLIRQRTVPGVGVKGATLMVITPPPAPRAGETDSPLPPSEDEYLGKWLKALGLEPRKDAFITPVVKCRTPGNRPPRPEEAGACSSYLMRQFAAVRPQAVLALGSSACGALCGNPAQFPHLVGRDWEWNGVPAMVLWTPAEVLAHPTRLRAPVWEALQRLKAAW